MTAKDHPKTEAQSINLDDVTVTSFESLSDIDEQAWTQLAPTQPFLSYGFLKALEDSSSVGPIETGWIPRFLALTAPDGHLLAALPQYLKTHSQGEYVFDHGWAEAYERAGGRYYPKLQSSIPFTPVTGPRLLVNKQQSAANQQLLQKGLLSGAKQLCDQMGLSSLHLTFIEESEAALCAEQGLLMRTDQQFHWLNNDFDCFDDFLSTLSSRKRKQIRKERRTAQSFDLTIEALSGGDIKEHHWDAFFACYQDTGQRKWGRPYLTRDFFSLVHQTIPDQILLIYVSDPSGRPVACALNFMDDTALYGRHWGALAHYDCLHFEACYYQAIDFAIAHKLKRVEAGAQGPHKVARGYSPVMTRSAHYLPDPGFHTAVERYLRQERQHVAAEISYFTDHLPFKKS